MGVISDGVEILGLVNKGANADLYAKLGKYIDEVQSLYAQREKLEGENKALKEQLRFKGTTVRVMGCTYVEGEQEPICSRCAEVDNRPVHFVTQVFKDIGRQTVCPQCKNTAIHQYTRSTAERLLREAAASRGQ